jgi:hypothetical protein
VVFFGKIVGTKVRKSQGVAREKRRFFPKEQPDHAPVLYNNGK